MLFFESFAYFKNQNLKFEDQKITTFVSVLNIYMCVYLYMCVLGIIRWIFISKFRRVLSTS